MGPAKAGPPPLPWRTPGKRQDSISGHNKKPRFLSEARFHFGGDKRDRTADLLHAMQALSQLSYTPIYSVSSDVLCQPTCIEYHSRGILSSGF